MSRLCAILIAAALCAGAALPAVASAATADEIIVRRDDGLTAAERAAVRADAGVTLVETLPLADTEVVRAAPGDRPDALADLRSDPDVVWAEPNRERTAAGVSDPYFSLMWGLQNTGQSIRGASGTPGADIDALDAWAFTKGRGVTVGVVDSGAQATHPDLQLVTGHDFIDGDSDTDDQYGHGTHVSGTIAAAENGRGVIGVAPGARVMPLRILDATGHGSSANSAAAFAYAGNLGLRVVNASIGATGVQNSSQAEYDAIHDHPNTLYVVAAGNGGLDEIGDDNEVTPTYPCSYNLANILCVGATDSTDKRAAFSNYGATSVDISAPGVDVVSTYTGSTYYYMGGTSMATPPM